MKDFIASILKNIFTVEGTIAIATNVTHFNIYDFDFRRYFDIRPLMSESELPLALRIGAIADYKEIYLELKQLGLTLINSPEQHDVASLLPHWYPKIQKHTARSKVYEIMPSGEDIMNDFEFPVFIKGERQTNKHKKSLCVATTKAELDHILHSWETDPILNWQRLICRQFLKLEKVADNSGDQLPFSNEQRVFLWKNNFAAIGQYWTEAKPVLLSQTDMMAIKMLTEKVALLINVPFLVVDVGKQENGDWIVIELNDAQESGYAGVSKLQLWQAILEIESNVSQ